MKIRPALPLVSFVALAASVGCHSPAPVTGTQASGAPLVWQTSPGQPTYYINSVAVSGDGSKVVGGTFLHTYGASSASPATANAGAATAGTASDNQTGTFGTYAYDRTGKQLWKDEFNGWQGVYWVDICTSGAFAASGGWFSQNPYAGFVRAYDAATGQRLLDYRTKNRVNQVALSADGTWLISAAESLVLFKLSSGTFQKAAEFPAPASTGGSNYFVSAAFSADGGVVVCSDYAGHIMLLNSSGGALNLAQQWTLPNQSSSHMVRLTPDGHTFVAGGPAGSFYLFDSAQFVSTGLPTITYATGVSGSVYSVAVADDGSAFVGVVNYQSTAGKVYYVTRQGSQPTLKWTYQTAHNPNCAWLNLAKGMLAVADGHPDGSPGAFYLLDTGTGALRWQYGTSNMSWPIMISEDGSGIAAGSDDSNIYYFVP